jgi:hypothetical protein
MLQSLRHAPFRIHIKKEDVLFRIRNGVGVFSRKNAASAEQGAANLRQSAEQRQLGAGHPPKREKPKTPRSMYVSGIFHANACISREMFANYIFFCLRV